jgi:hypothetical protein
MFKLLPIDGHNMDKRSAEINFNLTMQKKGSFKVCLP